MKKILNIFAITLIVLAVIICGFAVANKLNEASMNEYIDTFSKVEIENQLTPEYDEYGVPYFTTDGDFKVMQLTDIHLTGGILGSVDDRKAIYAIAAMISAEKPDLVVVTGDISFAVPWAATLDNSYAHNYFIRLMENLGVYWTVAFGNHDSEVYDFYDRTAVAKMYDSEDLKYCLFTTDDGDVYGDCNHVINVRNTQGLVSKSVIVMDTNSYTDEDPMGFGWVYDNIHEDQIEWYRGVVNRYSDYNKTLLNSMPESEIPENEEDFTTVKSLIFVHIPIMEVREAYNEYLAAGETSTDDVKYLFGVVKEKDPYVYCSEVEEQMFETMIDLGSTQAMFYGHDHINNIMLEYKGIVLCYGYSVDYFAYWEIDKSGSQRGCTMITCSPDAGFNIKHENYYQDKYSPIDMGEVDMTK